MKAIGKYIVFYCKYFQCCFQTLYNEKIDMLLKTKSRPATHILPNSRRGAKNWLNMVKYRNTIIETMARLVKIYQSMDGFVAIYGQIQEDLENLLRPAHLSELGAV